MNILLLLRYTCLGASSGLRKLQSQRIRRLLYGMRSGRWALLIAPRVGTLNCIDPSLGALGVAQRKLAHMSNAIFVNARVSDAFLPFESHSFGYYLSVLHNIRDTATVIHDFSPPLPWKSVSPRTK